MEKTLEQIATKVFQAIENAKDLRELDQVRVDFLGKKGALTDILKEVGQLPPAERPKAGQSVNELKIKIQHAIETNSEKLRLQELNKRLESEKVDVTLPSRGQALGHLHPVTRTTQRVVAIFHSMGFKVVEGPEIEDEYHNFEALNIPSHHPARAMHDTFYLNSGLLLRTHTSPVQIRTMKESKPPLRIITPGRVYRHDFDQTHTPMFHQLEGLVVDETCSFANLKMMLQDFLNEFFESKLQFRFRPSYFPFTEPSAELDIMGPNGWLEILGCGMVHPQVLENVGIDSERYSGFAFGIGLDRMAMLYYGIDDLRKMFEGDARFLEQF